MLTRWAENLKEFDSPERRYGNLVSTRLNDRVNLQIAMVFKLLYLERAI